MAALFTFPNPVNEKAARTVAGLVVLLTLATLLSRSPWLLWALAIGFALRVASGPRFSPFGLLATRIVATRRAREEEAQQAGIPLENGLWRPNAQGRHRLA